MAQTDQQAPIEHDADPTPQAEDADLAETLDLEGDYSQQEEGAEQQQDRHDWKGEAMYLRGLMEGQQKAQPQQPPEPESQRLRREIQELRQEMPQVDPSQPDPEAFWKRDQIRSQVEEKMLQLQDAVAREQSTRFAETQAEQTLRNYMQQWGSNDLFRSVQGRFEEFVKQLPPQQRADINVLEMARKNLMWDAQQARTKGGAVQDRRSPPSPPNAAHNRTPQPKPKQMQWRNDQERAVGEFYGMTPEEYYNEPASPDTNNNGIQIYHPGRDR